MEIFISKKGSTGVDSNLSTTFGVPSALVSVFFSGTTTVAVATGVLLGKKAGSGRCTRAGLDTVGAVVAGLLIVSGLIIICVAKAGGCGGGGIG